MDFIFFCNIFHVESKEDGEEHSIKPLYVLTCVQVPCSSDRIVLADSEQQVTACSSYKHQPLEKEAEIWVESFSHLASNCSFWLFQLIK